MTNEDSLQEDTSSNHLQSEAQQKADDASDKMTGRTQVPPTQTLLNKLRAAQKAIASKLHDTVGSARPVKRDIRLHPTLPLAYEVQHISEIRTSIKRLGNYEKKKKKTMIDAIKDNIAYYKRIFPLLCRFMRETMLPLEKQSLCTCKP